MKYKKFWILYDGRELVEDIDLENEVEGCGGVISSGGYQDNISIVTGDYITMLDETTYIGNYRKKLIRSLVDEQCKNIAYANSKIFELMKKL